jgi:hypothetical protein
VHSHGADQSHSSSINVARSPFGRATLISILQARF